MPRYLTSHNMACMTRQGARELAQRMRGSTEVEFLRLLADMTSGQLIGEFNAASRDVIQRWMEKAGIHYEWLHRIDFEATTNEIREL